MRKYIFILLLLKFDLYGEGLYFKDSSDFDGGVWEKYLYGFRSNKQFDLREYDSIVIRLNFKRQQEAIQMPPVIGFSGFTGERPQLESSFEIGINSSNIRIHERGIILTTPVTIPIPELSISKYYYFHFSWIKGAGLKIYVDESIVFQDTTRFPSLYNAVATVYGVMDPYNHNFTPGDIAINNAYFGFDESTTSINKKQVKILPIRGFILREAVYGIDGRRVKLMGPIFMVSKIPNTKIFNQNSNRR